MERVLLVLEARGTIPAAHPGLTIHRAFPRVKWLLAKRGGMDFCLTQGALSVFWGKASRVGRAADNRGGKVMADTLLKNGERVEGQDDLDEPGRFKVLLHNDDYTTMDFVVMILQSVFNRDIETATEIMLNVHKQGVGVAGVYKIGRAHV